MNCIFLFYLLYLIIIVIEIKMFDSLKKDYNYIISEIGIVGYLEEEIIKRGLDTETNLPLNLLYSFPSKESSIIGNLNSNDVS